MKNLTTSRAVDLIMITAGMTGYLQLRDLAVDKPFADYLRAEYEDRTENRLQTNVRGIFWMPG